MRYAIITLTLLLAGCAQVDFDAHEAGKFKGAVSVFWVEQRLEGAGSEGKFLYIPLPGNELRFERPNGQVIRPALMYTDGGSVPRAVQPFRGFSPWSYGPVYIIHDWLFVARRCPDRVEYAQGTPDYAQMPFQESVDIFIETLKALQDSDRIVPTDFSQETVTRAIASQYSRNTWQKTNDCSGDKITKRDRELARKIIGARQIETFARRRTDVLVVDDKTVRLVAEIRF